MSNKLRTQHISIWSKLVRGVWSIVWMLMYRPSPVPFHAWRRLLLRCFGARIGKAVHPYPTSKIWAPWNLTMSDGSCLSHHVDCYSVDLIFLGPRVTVSQYSRLCTATHDYNDRAMPLLTAPIFIESDAWVTADVFIGPGVIVGEGAVIGARSTILKDIPPWNVVAGNPPRTVGFRKLKEN